MAKTKYIKDKRNEIIYPITRTAAVLENDGTTLPDKLYSMQEDINSKEPAIADLETIREGASLGSTAYRKPSSGIPQSDFDQITRDTLANVVLFGEEVGTV